MFFYGAKQKIFLIAIMAFITSCQRHNETTSTQKSPFFSVASVTTEKFKSAKNTYNDQITYDTADHKKENGWLKLPVMQINGSVISFHDTGLNQEDASARGYYYAGHYSNPDLYIVYGLFYEDWEYYLIDKRNGTQTTLWDKPYISPKRKFIACFRCDGLEGQPCGLQIWQINNVPENEAEPLQITNVLQLDQKIWNPEDLVWDSDTSLLVKIKSLSNYGVDKPKVDSPQYLRFTFQ